MYQASKPSCLPDTVVDLADMDPDCIVFKELCFLYEEQQALSEELSSQIEMVTVTQSSVTYGMTYTMAELLALSLVRLYTGGRHQTPEALWANLWGTIVHTVVFRACCFGKLHTIHGQQSNCKAIRVNTDAITQLLRSQCQWNYYTC